MLVQDRTAAWDVSQDIWLGAIGGLARLRRVGDFSAWLYRIAHNKAVSYLRKKHRLNEQEEAHLLEHLQREGENPREFLEGKDYLFFVGPPRADTTAA